MTIIRDKNIEKILKEEDISLQDLKNGIDEGHIVVPGNVKRPMDKPCAIGKGTKTKVNANIGVSPGRSSIGKEIVKVDAAVEAGADAVMDLSTGPLLWELRTEVLQRSPVPVGTVPVYELACSADRPFKDLTEDDFFEVLKKQAEEGVDFFTIHTGVTMESVEYAASNPRLINIVSRGGALLASWMKINNKENPFFTQFDRIVDLAKKYDITLSLGDSMRPGATADATDHLQLQELLILGKQQKIAHDKGVQVMIEGPGHMPLDQIEANVKLQKKICHGSPFYVLGPLVTDAAPGYDHIVSAIGGAIAAWHGADFLCYVTSAEHLRLPDVDAVTNGVIASKIAAHAADIAKGLPSAIKRDNDISRARAKRDWKTQFDLALDRKLPEKMRSSDLPNDEDVCTMCSDFCSIKITEKTLFGEEGK